MRRVITATAPFIMILIAWTIASKVEHYDGAIQYLIVILPYIFAMFALIMSLWYQNSNAFYLVCFILSVHIFLNISVSKPPMLLTIATYASILLPINAIWLGFSKERGIFSTYGRNKAIIIAVQLIWIFINMMGKYNIQADIKINEPAITIRIPAFILFAIAIGILTASFILKSNYLNLAFISILVMALISLHFAHRPLLLAVFTTTIFSIIIIALFDVSYSLAFRDTLTGVLSRRALEQELLKLGNKYSIAIADLDHFKHINDNFGHDVGDEVLKMVASILENYSGRAKVFRYGGEEFILLFNRISYNDEVILQLERIRKAVERRPFILRSDNRPKNKPNEIDNCTSKGRGVVNVTLSIGVAHKTDLLKTCQDVIRKADEALYRSKNCGRNCVTKF